MEAWKNMAWHVWGKTNVQNGERVASLIREIRLEFSQAPC